MKGIFKKTHSGVSLAICKLWTLNVGISEEEGHNLWNLIIENIILKHLDTTIKIEEIRGKINGHMNRIYHEW